MSLMCSLCRGGGGGIKIKAYEVPSITQIRNEFIEIRNTEYPHQQGLWFWMSTGIALKFSMSTYSLVPIISGPFKRAEQ